MSFWGNKRLVRLGSKELNGISAEWAKKDGRGVWLGGKRRIAAEWRKKTLHPAQEKRGRSLTKRTAKGGSVRVPIRRKGRPHKEKRS